MYCKIVKDDSCGRLTSFIGSYYFYRVGKVHIRKPNTGPMAVFKNIDAARNFLNREIQSSSARSFYHIYACEIIPSDEKVLYYPNHNMVSILALPKGTVLADAVKLIKEIK